MSTEVLGRPAAPSNGHSRAVDLFSKAFDAGEIAWIDDVPVFEDGQAVKAARVAADGLANVVLAPVHPKLRRPAPPPAPQWQPPKHSAPRPVRAEPGLRPAPQAPRRARTKAPVAPAHLAWLAVVPVGLVSLVLLVVAPALGGAVLPDPSWTAFPSVNALWPVRPEPGDQMSYLVSLAAPVVVIVLVALGWKQVRGCRRRRRLEAVVIGVQVAGLALAVTCWVLQRSSYRWFSGGSLVVAILMACGLLLLARGRGLWARPRRVSNRRRLHGWLALGTVVVVSGVWLLPSVYLDSNVAGGHEHVRLHLQFTFDEFLSAINGRTPTVDFVPQYSRVLPFLVAPVLEVFGSTVGVFTWTMWALSLIAVVAVYLMFRVVTGGPVAALVPWAPFVGMTMFTLQRTGAERVYLPNYYGLVPLRVVGPFVVAWLCAVQLRKPRRGGGLALFLLSGLVALNNPEFGVPCFVGVVAALWCGHDGSLPGWRRARMLLAQAAVGFVAALALVSLYTLLRTSSLPRWSYFNHFARIFAVEGFAMLPMPLFGLHVVIYLTFFAALLGALTQGISAQGHRDRALIGMLAYSGVLGLGALSYWVGRSHPAALFGMFPTWGLAVALLAWWVLSSVARRSSTSAATVRVWVLPSAATLVVFGLMATTIPEIPSPGPQLSRLDATVPPPAAPPPSALEVPSSFSLSRRSAAVRFVSDFTSPGEHIGILASLGHGVAERSGVVNASPYTHPLSIVFEEQMDFVLDELGKEGARKIFLGPSYYEIPDYLRKKGYEMMASDEESRLSLWLPKRRT